MTGLLTPATEFLNILNDLPFECQERLQTSIKNILEIIYSNITPSKKLRKKMMRL